MCDIEPQKYRLSSSSCRGRRPSQRTVTSPPGIPIGGVTLFMVISFTSVSMNVRLLFIIFYA